MRQRVLTAVFATLVAAFGFPLVAAAHALPVSSSPAQDSMAATAPAAVTITFNERPDAGLSTISVIDSSGSSVTSGPTTAAPSNSDELEVPLKSIGRGTYTVTWRTVSAVDGHLAAGSFAFGVGEQPSGTAAPPASPPPSPLAVVSAALLSLALMTSLGLVVVSLAALRARPRFAVRVMTAGWIVAIVATLGITESQREAVGISWSGLLGSSLGTTFLWRGGAAALMGLALLLFTVGPWRSRRSALGVFGATAALAMATDVAASHAGAQSPEWLNLLAQWLHLAAAGIWVGGLACVLLALGGEPPQERRDAVRRFSTLAGACIVLVGVTGIFRAVIEIPSWTLLTGSAFGILVLVKAGLFLLLAVLGGLNRYRNIAARPTRLRAFRVAASSEIVIALAVVTVAATLVNVAPPVSASSGPAPRQVSITGSDFATTVRLHLTITPGVAGTNDFSAQVNDYQTGAMLQASSVELHLTQPYRPQLPETDVTLTRQADGTLRAHSAALAFNGLWRAAAIVQNGAQSTEVDLQFATAEPQPSLQVVRFTGLPTVYNVQLGKGRLASVYLDPGAAGSNEFHVTYETAAGTEIAVPAVTVGMLAPQSAPRILVSRPLDDIGHAVADTGPLVNGDYRFDVIGTTPSGDVLATWLTITVG